MDAWSITGASLKRIMLEFEHSLYFLNNINVIKNVYKKSMCVHKK